MFFFFFIIIVVCCVCVCVCVVFLLRHCCVSWLALGRGSPRSRKNVAKIASCLPGRLYGRPKRPRQTTAPRPSTARTSQAPPWPPKWSSRRASTPSRRPRPAKLALGGRPFDGVPNRVSRRRRRLKSKAARRCPILTRFSGVSKSTSGSVVHLLGVIFDS